MITSFVRSITSDLCIDTKGTALSTWADELSANLAASIEASSHAQLPTWLTIIAQLPVPLSSPLSSALSSNLNSDVVLIGHENEMSDESRVLLREQLLQLKPWRKGPFSIFGIHLDTEWRSDLKWQRLVGHISPLLGRTVLDVGCGSGYHCLRMAGAGARLVIGIEPVLLYNIQFYVLKRYLGKKPVYVLPYTLEKMPTAPGCFDSVFSMGVIYHRRDPMEHLASVRQCLRPGGELVLESLVIDAVYGEILIPRERYAKMRNVWGIPSCALLERWLAQAGFDNIKRVDLSITTTEEQRSTEWMQFESLAEFLDPLDPSRTVEDYPAPQRAIYVATKPE